MYTHFFGLKEKPFSITPDPRYLFMSERHAEALAHLMYGVNEAGGFVQLTGEIGTGKTTLVRSMLEKMPQHADVAVILNPRISPLELLLSICQELRVLAPDNASGSIKALVDALNERLLSAHAQGRRVIVIVDEAQNLSAETLEQVRLLTNLETASTKLLQIILIGQPELREVLNQSGLKQLAQRITGRYHLAPLSREETVAYIRHRLKIAGANGEIFLPGALREVHRVSEGVPRVINVICDRALLGAYAEESARVDATMIRRAASEVFDRPVNARWLNWAGASVAALAIGILTIAALKLLASPPQLIAARQPQPAVIAPPQAPAAALVAQSAADVSELFKESPNTATMSAAFSNLFSLWNAHFNDKTRPCDQALSQGLECVSQKGSWAQLRILNRPAILTLTDDAGIAHQVVVDSLGDNTAHIAVGDRHKEVTVASLSRYWLGDYLMLWRPQVSGQRALSVGMRGHEVQWLRDSLNRVQGGAEDNNGVPSDSAADTKTAADYFDDSLAKRVQSFQREHRLTIDGIAGVQTQIALDSVVDQSNAPKLLNELTTQKTNPAPAQVDAPGRVNNGNVHVSGDAIDGRVNSEQRIEEKTT